MRRNTYITAANGAQVYLEQYDGEIKIATPGHALIHVTLTVQQATDAYDLLAAQVDDVEDERRQAEQVEADCTSDAHRRGLL